MHLRRPQQIPSCATNVVVSATLGERLCAHDKQDAVRHTTGTKDKIRNSNMKLITYGMTEANIAFYSENPKAH